MAITITPKKAKRHNWVTNARFVDPDTNRIATRFIDACVHLTPAREAELDNLLGVGSPTSTAQCNPEILSAYEDFGDWDDTPEPTDADLVDSLLAD